MSLKKFTNSFTAKQEDGVNWWQGNAGLREQRHAGSIRLGAFVYVASITIIMQVDVEPLSVMKKRQ